VVFAGEREPLRSGDAVPSGSFEDIAGDRTSTADYGGWVHVLTFADRESSEELKAWLSGAQIRATRAHPELRVAYLSFADLSSVPRLLRGMVRPILRKSFEHSNDDLAESYRKVGIEPDPEKVAFRFIPDWDGALLEVFGLRDATAYRCWIALDGVVVESLDAATADIAARYVAAFDRIAAERSAFAARVPRAGR
jgi:hypothetical protein